MFRKLSRASFISAIVTLFVGVQIGCSVEASKIPDGQNIEIASVKDAPKGATIDIQPNSPADTVRAFYAKLREKKFREAIFLTNLRPAIEGLTDDELKEFAVDFEAIAKFVPPVIEINGEIISGDQATVTAKLPDVDSEKVELQQLRLRKEGDVWVILSVDDDAEKLIKKEGKNYFYALRIETHQEEARKMLERVAKAQMVHSLQNKGSYGETAKLIEQGLLPADITSSESTGYVYTLSLAADRKSYSATATPAAYGKSGKLSYILELDASGKPHVRSIDNGGKKIAM